MGNQLSIGPYQIYPVERYLTDHPELKFDTSLGSTRFLKVARAESPEGLVVVKFFAIHDPSLPLVTYKNNLEDVKKKLSSAVNCIPFQKSILTDKAGLIIREYVKYSLYDRLSTRPFLTNIEKRWITFQILYALHQCHKVGVCHGDIKLENITVTSWNWVLLVDFASFKPTFLPVDNPGDYSYFFDTSRRRTCYIAPERFSSGTNAYSENSSVIPEAKCDSSNLTPAMDIFSAGCALLELWNELHVPFEYSQLLAYRAGKYSPEKDLDNLEDPDLKELISNMIEIDPSKRRSAEDYLAQYRGSLFPEYFFTFLQSYMLIFSANPILSPDEKIMRLKNDIKSIFKFLGPQSTDDKGKQKDECEGLVLITSLVTSCIRGLHDCSSKLFCLEILLELSSHASEETILDRILPYIIFLAHDPSARVKICAINTITKCLDLVVKIPRWDSNVFPEYILPELAPLATDPNTCVRAAYAKNVAKLAEISLRYLEQMQYDWYDSNSINKKEAFNYELELLALHDMISQTVSALLTDTQSYVKQTLVDNGITKLCLFFGKLKANDIILSHMITFLNDKEDKELRGSYFDCIIGVAAYIGWPCASILTPLLLQGLTDCSEFVTAKCINAMAALTELGLLFKPGIVELVAECSYFMVHPNLWIRQEVAGFISTAAKVLGILDVQCKLMRHLKVYMKYSLIQIDRPELVLESLVSPIPRVVYDSVVSYSEIGVLLDILRERKNLRDCVNTGKVFSSDLYRESNTSLKNLIRRLEANGMNETTEEHLLRMEHHLKKLNKHKTNADARHARQRDNRIELNPSSVKNYVFNLGDTQKGDFMPGRALHRTNTCASIETNVNSDWNYSSEVLTRHSEGTNSGGPSSRSTSSRPSSPPVDTHNQFISTDPSSNISLHERSYIQYRRSSCYIELSNLKNRQQEHYFEALRNKDWKEHTTWRPQLPPPGWHLRGRLMAHLHEHRAAVNKLCALPDMPLFASCSVDGSVRLWDCAKLEGKTIANRSKQQYKMSSGSPINGMTFCEGGQSLTTVCENGTVNVLRIDPTSSKMNLIQSRQVDPTDDGFALDVNCLDSGSQSVVVYSTLYGSIVGWDLRAPNEAWRLENGVRKGLITSFCVDTHQSWLALGTSNGHHTIWDLRFQLPITTIEHPSGSVRIRRVVPHPTEHSWVLSSIQGNNEVSMWNIETGFRQKVLWGSTAPPLSKTGSSGASNSVCAILGGCIDRTPFVLGGGTDQRIRFWDLGNPSESYLAVPAASDPMGTMLCYKSRLIDGTHVIYEESSKVNKDEESGGPRAGPDPPPEGHRDCITDAVLCKASQCFLVTASRDGVVKVWK